jgi:hypothetical protein
LVVLNSAGKRRGLNTNGEARREKYPRNQDFSGTPQIAEVWTINEILARPLARTRQGRGRDEKDKTIGRDEKCPLAKRPAKVLLFEHICNRKSGLQIQYVGHERKAKCPTFF